MSQFGLGILDLSDPIAPIWIGGKIVIFVDLEVVGDLIIGSGGGFAPTVLDVSDPAEPFWLGGTTLNSARDTEVSGEFVFAAGGGGLQVVDFGPEYTPLPEPAADLAIAAGTAILALLRSRHGAVLPYSSSTNEMREDRGLKLRSSRVR